MIFTVAVFALLLYYSTGREVNTKIIAENWETTPWSPICEAHMYWQALDALYDPPREKKISHEFINAFDQRRGDDIISYSDGINISLEVSRGLVSSDFEMKGLEYSLGIREFSPACELHRQLTVEAMKTQQEKFLDLPSAFIEVRSTCLNTIITRIEYLNQLKLEGDCEAIYSESNLNDEIVLRMPNGTSNMNVSRAYLVLYGRLGTESFHDFYNVLRKLDYPIDLIFRHTVRYPKQLYLSSTST